MFIVSKQVNLSEIKLVEPNSVEANIARFGLWFRDCFCHVKRGFVIAIVCVLGAFSITSASVLAKNAAKSTDEFTTVYLVRHAEKEVNQGKDPALTDQGKFRAEFLANMFTQIPLDRVYSTDTIRTRDTASPTAKSQGLEVVIYDARGVDHIDFLQQNQGKTVLVVGHSNTIPAFVNGLLGNQKYTELDEAEYDSLFVVNINGEQKIDRLLTLAARINKKSKSEEKHVPQHEKIDYLEYAAKDIEGTKEFFGKAFGWEFQDFGPDYTSFENQGLNGGFYRADMSSSATKGAALTVFYSDSLEATEAKVVAAGGVISTAIFDFPGGRRFHFIEPSGNEFAVWGE